MLKMLKVKEIADKVIYQQHKKMLKAPVVDVCNPQLVGKEENIDIEGIIFSFGRLKKIL